MQLRHSVTLTADNHVEVRHFLNSVVRYLLVVFLQHTSDLRPQSALRMRVQRQFIECEGHRVGGCLETRQEKSIALSDEIVSVEF
jgi:hypothetical protein